MFLQNIQVLVVDNKYFFNLEQYIYCRENIHAKLEMIDSCLKNIPYEKFRGVLVRKQFDSSLMMIEIGLLWSNFMQ